MTQNIWLLDTAMKLDKIFPASVVSILYVFMFIFNTSFENPLIPSSGNSILNTKRSSLPQIVGLSNLSVAAKSIFIYVEGPEPGSTVTFYIDDKVVDIEKEAPYWLGGVMNDEPRGFDIERNGYGVHHIHALVVDSKKDIYRSNKIDIRVIPSNNNSFSRALVPYHSRFNLKQFSGSSRESSSFISSQDERFRASIVDMYRSWGVDLFLDDLSDQSLVLRSLFPRNWIHPKSTSGQLWSMMFSSDSVFYHTIPAEWPRVELPHGYFQKVQLNTAQGGDGIGFGQAIATRSNKTQTIKSQWYDVLSTLRLIQYRIPPDWPQKIPTTASGDRHVVFIDPENRSFVSAYKVSIDPSNKEPDSLYAAGPTSFDSMGDFGGSIAANFAELPLLIQPGESTNITEPIRHAIGGPVRRVWAARVYPASAWDADVKIAKDTCSGTGHMNTGLIPYGGVIQLDPKLNLKKFNLSLPAFRVLEAMQTYGYYVMDYGCADMDIYTALNASELDIYGGLWGSAAGVGVQNEIERVIRESTLYVVAPLYKKE